MAKLPDNVGNVTIDGQNHKITRDTFVNPNTILMDPEMGDNEAVMSILMNPGISLMSLEDGAGGDVVPKEHYTGAILQIGENDELTLKNVTVDGEGQWEIDEEILKKDIELNKDYDIDVLTAEGGGHPIRELEENVVSTESLIKVSGGTLKLEGAIMKNFFAGDGYDDDRHFTDLMSTEDAELYVTDTTFEHNASRAGVIIGNTDKDNIYLNSTTMTDNYCYGGNGGLVVAMEGTQVYMDESTSITKNVAADTNGVFIQLHKKDDLNKDGDNKGTIYSTLHMKGGDISHNIGLRGGSYGWGQTVYMYNGGAFIMDGGEVHDNMGAGISSIYQQPSADALQLNAGKIYNNTCSLTDEYEGMAWALDIALMNEGTLGEGMEVDQNFVVGAAAILGGYVSGDEYLTNNGVINGNISVYSYFNNEGHVSSVLNNNTINGDIRLENGSSVTNGADGKIKGNIKVRGALTESAGESQFHNEGYIEGNVELAPNSHLYNSGEIKGNVTVMAGATLTMNCNNPEHMEHGGTLNGDLTLYPGGLIRADVKPTYINGDIYLECESERDHRRMLDVLDDAGIIYDIDKVHFNIHEHTEPEEPEVIEPDPKEKCIEPWIEVYTCTECGEEIRRVEKDPPAHDFYVYSTDEQTCTTGKIEHISCHNCEAYNSGSTEIEYNVPDEGTEGEEGYVDNGPLGHDYVEIKQLYIPPHGICFGVRMLYLHKMRRYNRVRNS